jgi:hypothetical protein
MISPNVSLHGSGGQTKHRTNRKPMTSPTAHREFGQRLPVDLAVRQLRKHRRRLLSRVKRNDPDDCNGGIRVAGVQELLPKTAGIKGRLDLCGSGAAPSHFYRRTRRRTASGQLAQDSQPMR